jgi:hypothetical protein
LDQVSPISILSLRGLCVLGVSAVNNRFKYTHGGDAENAEVALRISKPGHYQILATLPTR